MIGKVRLRCARVKRACNGPQKGDDLPFPDNEGSQDANHRPHGPLAASCRGRCLVRWVCLSSNDFPTNPCRGCGELGKRHCALLLVGYCGSYGRRCCVRRWPATAPPQGPCSVKRVKSISRETYDVTLHTRMSIPRRQAGSSRPDSAIRGAFSESGQWRSSVLRADTTLDVLDFTKIPPETDLGAQDIVPSERDQAPCVASSECIRVVRYSSLNRGPAWLLDVLGR
jgi:hypothetical protein